MGRLQFGISISLDGYLAGPNPSLERPLGGGGERLHQWAYGLATFRSRHGESGGETNVDDEVLAEETSNVGATIMGRQMYSGGSGPWESDPNAGGWWGHDPPFHHPVFVLTHHERAPLVKDGGTTFTFVTDGIESALKHAQEAAGARDVTIGGGADVVQQYLRAGLVDEFQVHVAPVFLGAGTRLLEALPSELGLECTRAVHSPAVTHLKYRVVR